MADTGKQSPLGINVLGTLLQNAGFYINPTAQGYFGVSRTNGQYTPGSIVNDTSLLWLTYAINDAFLRGAASQSTPESPTPPYTVNAATYENLINIGQSRIAALGNSPPPTYVVEDPSGVWDGEATSGYPIPGDGTIPPPDPIYDNIQGQGQDAKWFPFKCTGTDANPNISVSQWGWIRLLALQAWNEFNWNGEEMGLDPLDPLSINPEYIVQLKEFTSSFMSGDSFVNFSNKALIAMQNSKTYLKGIYSNMDDFISGDISGVTLSSRGFGQDLINIGKALDLSTINTFGLPSNLLKTLKKNKSITKAVSLALLAAELEVSEIEGISSGNITPVSKTQEQKIYSAFLFITGTDLQEVLQSLNCKTKNLTSLADLLSIKKIFPISYTTLTVPVWNVAPGPTNSKTYYLLFVNQELNPQLIAPKIKETIGTIVPPGEPPISTPPPVIQDIKKVEAIITAPISTLPSAPITAPPTTGGGGGCVVLESWLPEAEETLYNGSKIRHAWQIMPGHKIQLADESTLEDKIGIVKMAAIEQQPCVRITTDTGASLVCSTTAPIPTLTDGIVHSIDLLGNKIPVARNNTRTWETVIKIEEVGYKFVRAIDTNNNSFWAGELDGIYILHHNVSINKEFQMEKK